ncbi:hypothetical protein LOK49_LG14G00172 [Camellia lanceoleosa]|uniref:Uncharacterized protein n=1 Tax=Camellia lanceoleosa TaxID=1840588 RepID=A0ACC0FDS6_9ERIC|nr:hypothetical protein LOK49_LG14G00172 [Camellia lanceoleosa]
MLLPKPKQKAPKKVLESAAPKAISINPIVFIYIYISNRISIYIHIHNPKWNSKPHNGSMEDFILSLNNFVIYFHTFSFDVCIQF